jgi:hypothetical protein
VPLWVSVIFFLLLFVQYHYGHSLGDATGRCLQGRAWDAASTSHRRWCQASVPTTNGAITRGNQAVSLHHRCTKWFTRLAYWNTTRACKSRFVSTYGHTMILRDKFCFKFLVHLPLINYGTKVALLVIPWSFDVNDICSFCNGLFFVF